MSEIVPAGDHAGGGSSGEHGPTEAAEPVGVAPSSTESTAASSGDLSLGLPLHPRVGDSIPPEVVEQLRQRRGQRTNARREAPVRRSSPGDAEKGKKSKKERKKKEKKKSELCGK
jgi:hypothetical protein